LFVSGQIPLDPVNGRVVGTTIEEQARQALTNLLAIVGSQGEDVYLIVKTTVYLKDINHFPAFNAVYESMLGSRCPARSVVAVNGLPKNVLVEIEAIACR
jgi:2-iminobutanoate/2-iminopropanoate deaminase